MALLIRLLPLGSNWMVSVAAGVSGVRSVPFFLGSALGYVPQMLIFSLVGSGARVDQFWIWQCPCPGSAASGGFSGSDDRKNTGTVPNSGIYPAPLQRVPCRSG